jgi:uncharacterized protein YegJ (DUF2314 family)
MTNNHKLLLTTILPLIAILLPACGQSITERAASDKVAYVDDEDEAMTRAFEKARASLDEFFRLAKSPKEGTEAYAIKVGVSDGDNTEYFWVNQFEVNGDEISGVLNNEPESVKKYRMGERFTFSRDDVVDWTYMEPAARRMHGNYTACALLSHEDPKDAEEFRQQYGLRCE